MKINLFENLASKSAIFHNEGLDIYRLLSESLSIPQNVELSFEGIENCSSQFLNASIGNCYVKFGESIVEKYLKLSGYQNIPLFDDKLNEVKRNAFHREEVKEIYHHALAY